VQSPLTPSTTQYALRALQADGVTTTEHDFTQRPPNTMQFASSEHA